MERVEYKVEKDKDFISKRYETYTIEKKVIYDNGKTESRFITFIPFRDGDIKQIDLNTLKFPKPITEEEWKQLPKEYKTAWLKGTMTEEIKKYGESCLQLIRERRV